MDKPVHIYCRDVTPPRLVVVFPPSGKVARNVEGPQCTVGTLCDGIVQVVRQMRRTTITNVTSTESTIVSREVADVLWRVIDPEIAHEGIYTPDTVEGSGAAIYDAAGVVVGSTRLIQVCCSRDDHEWWWGASR